MRSVRRYLPLALGLTAWGGSGAAAQIPTPAGPPPPPPFVEVSGTATVSVAPDRARVAFAVETQAGTAADAASANARLMDAVMRAVRALGVTGLQVETFGYQLRPDYAFATDDATRTRVIAGYTAVNNVRATVGDVTAVGRLVDAAIGAGANRVSALAFEASDTEAARREALTLAVARARGEAEAMATALGLGLGPPLEVHGGAEEPRPRALPGGILLRAEAAVETPIEAADQTVSASVTIRFALLGPAGGR